MTRSILLAGAVLLSVSISPLNAEASGAPWCAVMAEGDGDLPWACKYRSIEECRSNVIAGNRGFCNPNPSYVANPPGLKNSGQASPMGSKTIAEKKKALAEKTIAVKKKTLAEKTIAVDKESSRHRNANARTKIVASPITVKTPRQRGKPNAESKDTVATRIETPQPAPSDDKPNAESKDTVATRIETPQPAPSDDKSDAESKDTVATRIETPQPPSPPKPSERAKAAPMTKAATAQTLIKTISADKTKTQTYCDIGKLGDQIEEAEEKKDLKKIDELDQKMGELTTKLGPEYVALMSGPQDIDATSKELEDITLALAGLDKLCAK